MCSGEGRRSDAEPNVTDGIFILSHLFGGGGAPPCEKAADANDSGTVDLTDAVFVLNFLFAAGGDPAPPFQECGVDPTPDELTRESFGPCM